MHLIALVKIYGVRQRVAYVPYQHGWIEATRTDAGEYACGYAPPNYPVPAIPIVYRWEYKRGKYRPGLDLFDECVELACYTRD